MSEIIYGKDNFDYGWNSSIAEKEFKIFGGKIHRYYEYNPVDEPTGKRRFLYEYVRKVNDGKDISNINQLTGDCVSWMGRNCIDYLQCVEIILNSDRQKYRPTFPPFFYGTSRVQIGGGRIRGAGSTGIWMKKALGQYGSLFWDEEGIPQYSGRLADQWGQSGPPQNFLSLAKPYNVETTALIQNSRECADAIWKGYPVGVCSNQGFNMQASADGFHYPRGRWMHAMTITAFEDHPQHGLYFLVRNSWGNSHGQLRDFSTDDNIPLGYLRVRAATIDSMLRQNDSYAYSLFNGFPDNSDKLNKEDFKIFGG